jgi:hypothetical protein
MNNSNPKKICLITPGHIATNPRLVKEAEALLKYGYQVHIVFTQYVNELAVEDEQLLYTNAEVTFSVLDWTNRTFRSKFIRYTSGFRQKLLQVISKLISAKAFHKYLINRNYNWQLKQAINSKADLYIAHNLGALPVACNAAKKNGRKCAFDAEDFHRFEVSDNLDEYEVKLKAIIEEEYIPQVDHFTGASPLISTEYKRLFPVLKPLTILNVFPSAKHVSVNQTSPEKRLKLFWFSQTIGAGRGIENIIEALGKCHHRSFELHLLGSFTAVITETFAALAKRNNIDPDLIYFYQPISPDKIIAFASQFDIGMASETGYPYNRDICLTNKIFTYIQAGLAVVASDTKAQFDLLQLYPCIGKVYEKGNVFTLTQVLDFYYENRDALQNAKQESFLLGQSKMNWETEHKAFVSSIQNVLN